MHRMTPLLLAGACLAAGPAKAQEDCARAGIATVPMSYSDDTTGGIDDYDPGFSCIGQAAGPDHVYEYTPVAEERIDVIATPLSSTYDIAVYLMTDCSMPSSFALARQKATSG